MATPSKLSNSVLSETDAGNRTQWQRWARQLIDFKGVRRILMHIVENRANLRLRTKLLLSLVLSITALTCATLLAVRHSAQLQVRRQTDQDARNALLTIQAVQHQREMILSRKADMLATLAYMRGGDAKTIQDASEDPWQSGDCDLFVLANRKSKIVALRTTGTNVSVGTAEKLLQRSPRDDNSAGWWFGDGHLFQVVLQTFYEDEPRKGRVLGTVVMGRELDSRGASELGRISSSHLIFRSGDHIVMSTFSLAEEMKLEQEFLNRSMPREVQIGNERLFTTSIALPLGSDPALSLTVLKSDNEV